MRTTVTINPEIAQKLKELMKHQDKSFKEVLNDVLASGLAYKRSNKKVKFKVETFSSGLRPGVDWSRIKDLDYEEEARLYRQKAYNQDE